MTRTILFRLLGGMLMLLMAVGLTLTSPRNTTVKAQTNSSYTTDWTATNLLTVSSSGVGEAAIGASGWHVTGTVVQTGDKFSETWSIPSPLPTVSGANITSTDPAGWLLGLVTGGSYTFASKASSQVGALHPGGVSGLGASCSAPTTGSPYNCLVATGAYGWTNYNVAHPTGYPFNAYTVNAQGLALPLKWHIAGNFCPAGGDLTPCQ